MIGILLAIQVNNLNENRKLEKLENSYYINILNDLHNDSLEFERKNVNALRNISKLDNILYFINNDYDISKVEIDSVKFGNSHVYGDTLALIFSVSQAGFLQFPQVNHNTITDLRTTGNIKILKNDSLKNDILEYYTIDNLHSEWVDQLVSARIEIESVINKILNKKERIAYTLSEGLEIEDIDYDQFVRVMRQQDDFKEKIIGMLHVHHRIILQNNERIEVIDKLVEDIRKEVDQKI